MTMLQRHIKQFIAIDLMSAIADQEVVKDDEKLQTAANLLMAVNKKVIKYLMENDWCHITQKDRRRYERRRATVMAGIEAYWGDTMEGLEFVNSCLVMADECAKLTDCKVYLHRLWVQICDILSEIHDHLEDNYYKDAVEDFIPSGVQFGQQAMEAVEA